MRIAEYRPSHARLLARLWNASDSAWPVGLVRLRPKDAADWREGERQIDSLGRFVALADGQAVGYVRLFEWFDSPDATYVQWLNVHPAYQGKGIGKALLQKALDRTIALGYPRVDLHTWPGNDKAMPLYKRSGYMWVPGSHAYLQNYLPLLLAYEPARSFFAAHEWQATLKRDLARDHDAATLHGIDVFLYRFVAGPRILEMVVDRAARGITAFEDRDVRVEAWIPDTTLVEGRNGTIRWFVRNKTRSRVSVRIEARGPAGVRVRNPRPFELAARAARELSGKVSMPHVIRAPAEGHASLAIETSFVVGTRAIRVRSGFHPKAPLEFGWETDVPRLPAPGERAVVLTMRNLTGRRLVGRLRIAARDLRVAPDNLQVKLSKGGVRRISLRIANERGENRAARVVPRFTGSGVSAKRTLFLPCLAPGGRVAFADRENLILQSGAFRLVSSGVAGRAAVALADGTKLCEAYVYAGPPFFPADAWQHRWRGRAENAGSATPEVVRRFGSRRRPGMVLEHRWRAVGDRLLQIQAAIENRGTRAWTASLALDFPCGDDFFSVTIPTRRGPVTEAMMEFEWPDERRDVPLDRLAVEGWIHAGTHKGGFGVVWEPPASRTGFEVTGWAVPRIRMPPVRIEPGGRTEAAFWIVLSPDWRDAQSLWTQISGSVPHAAEGGRGSLQLEANPRVVLAAPAADVGLTVRNLRMRPVGGLLRIRPPAGIEAQPSRWVLRDLDLARPAQRSVRFRATKSVVGTAKVTFEDDRGVWSWDLPAVGIASRGSVRLSGGSKTRRVDNGLLSFAVAPAHAASVVSLNVRGHEYLISSFPRPGSFAWFRPFFGGIQPSVYQDEWPGDLFRERFRLSEARRGVWRGLRLSTRSAKSSLPRGTRVTVDYLTRPMSPVVLAALEVANGTAERQTYTATWWTFLGFDRKARCEATFERLAPRTWRTTRRVGWSAADGGFAVFRAPAARRSVAVAAAAAHTLEVFGLRHLGHHGTVTGELDLAPGARGTVLAALAVVPPHEADSYRVLRGLTVDALDEGRPK